jgi:hypothetical protein
MTIRRIDLSGIVAANEAFLASQEGREHIEKALAAIPSMEVTVNFGGDGKTRHVVCGGEVWSYAEGFICATCSAGDGASR